MYSLACKGSLGKSRKIKKFVIMAKFYYTSSVILLVITSIGLLSGTN